MGVRHQPHSSPSWKLALCAVGGAGARLGKGISCLCDGCPGLGTLPRSTARPCGVRPGPAARHLRASGVQAWGPVTNLTAHALVSWLCTLLGLRERA